jgi:hypothetical protein
MSVLNFTSSINTERISANSFNLLVSMYDTVDELYNSLYDSYGNANLCEDQMNVVLGEYLSSMRNQLNASIDLAVIKSRTKK